MSGTRKVSGGRLVELRGRTTQTDLASALRKRGHGTTQTTISRWESGQQQPHASVLYDLAAELGCTVDELYGDDAEESRVLPGPEEMVFALISRARAEELGVAMQLAMVTRR